MIAVLRPKADALQKDKDSFYNEIKVAGVNVEGSGFSIGKRLPSKAELAAFNAKMGALQRNAAAQIAGCDNLQTKIAPLPHEDMQMATVTCRSNPKDPACPAWQKIRAAHWQHQVGCKDAAKGVQEWNSDWNEYQEEWNQGMSSQAAAAKLEEMYTTPVSGNPRQRAIVIPRKLFLDNQDTATEPSNDPRARAMAKAKMRAAAKVNPGLERPLDTITLFSQAHPSRFVFLRRDVSEAPRANLNESAAPFTRMLRKGEAVLATREGSAVGRSVSIVSIDGNRGVVALEDLSVAPLPGLAPVRLTATDLTVADSNGKIIAGPQWTYPDATGFFLDEPLAWLDLLNPPEPETSRILDARQKTLACYQKQMERLDPNGKLRRHYDVVTYGRSGVEKVESAAVNFDRKACSVCGCKTFNNRKVAVMKKAIAPSQQQLFTTYDSVLKQLKGTDFAAAAKGALAGADDWSPSEI